MTTLERVRNVARQVADDYGANGTHESALISEVFDKFASLLDAEIATIKQDGEII